MVDALTAYLREATALRFDPATVNCGLWVAEWVRQRSGVFVAGGWDGQYEIDVLATASAMMAEFAETPSPRRGDVGVVLAPRPTAAICVGARWAALAPDGLAVAPWTCLKAWRMTESQADHA